MPIPDKRYFPTDMTPGQSSFMFKDARMLHCSHSR
jgi:hypothetical protein